MGHPYAFRVTFTPDGDPPSDASAARTLRIETDAETRDEVYSKAIQKAHDTGLIDSYALRRYWEPATVGVEYADPSWEGLDDILGFLDIHDDVTDYSKQFSVTELDDETPHIALEVSDSNHTFGDDVCRMFPEVTYVGPPAIHFFYDIGHPDKAPFKGGSPDQYYFE